MKKYSVILQEFDRRGPFSLKSLVETEADGLSVTLYDSNDSLLCIVFDYCLCYRRAESLDIFTELQAILSGGEGGQEIKSSFFRYHNNSDFSRWFHEQSVGKYANAGVHHYGIVTDDFALDVIGREPHVAIDLTAEK
jgi:hypothetical protein